MEAQVDHSHNGKPRTVVSRQIVSRWRRKCLICNQKHVYTVILNVSMPEVLPMAVIEVERNPLKENVEQERMASTEMYDMHFVPSRSQPMQTR